MIDWIVRGVVIKLHNKGHVYRSGSIFIAVKGKDEEDAIKQAGEIVDHFHHDEVYLKDDVSITMLSKEGG